MCNFRHFTFLVFKLQQNNLHKTLQNCEGVTILKSNSVDAIQSHILEIINLSPVNANALVNIESVLKILFGEELTELIVA